MNFVAPFLENVLHFPVTRQIYTMSIAPREGQIMGDDSVEARTADGQVVRVDASVIFALQPDAVVDTHQKWQGRYVDNLIRPQARGIIRDAVSQFGIEEVYGTQRFALSALIEEALEVQFEEGGLIMHDFVLRNIAFSPEYAASVEQKQIAEQLAQQAAFVVQQREQEAEQARATARGQRDAAIISAGGDAEAFGFRGDIWTQPRVTEVIRRQFQVSYHSSQVGRILKGCGWSRQKPVRRAVQRDEEAIQRWKEERWPQVKKSYRGAADPGVRRPVWVLPAANGVVHLRPGGPDPGGQGVPEPRPSFGDERHHARG